MWLVEILEGALARGTNKATLVLLNLSLLGCILLLSSLLVLPAGLPTELLPHIALLLLLAVGLLAAVNWLVAQTGTVSAEAQHQELFGGGGGEAPASASAPDRHLAPAGSTTLPPLPAGGQAGAAGAAGAGGAGGEAQEDKKEQ